MSRPSSTMSWTGSRRVKALRKSNPPCPIWEAVEKNKLQGTTLRLRASHAAAQSTPTSFSATLPLQHLFYRLAMFLKMLGGVAEHPQQQGAFLRIVRVTRLQEVIE